MVSFEDMAPKLVATAARLAKIRGAELEATVLERAIPNLLETGYDNWDNGITFYALMLEVPIPTYAALEESRDTLEKDIHRHVSQITRTDAGNRITEVVISPILADAARPIVAPADVDIPEEEVPTFWEAGFFRLFITHLAALKGSAHRLKQALARHQVAAFVAHDDIEPTREWQAEIERALRTADALVALMSPGFLESRWCDQEVGIAIGRGKLVLPLRVGADPHGFMGKYQALTATPGEDVSTLSQKIVDILIRNPQSSERMAEGLVEKLAASRSFDSSKQTVSLLEGVPQLNASQGARLVRAIEENGEVREAWGVPERIRALVARATEIES
jgi:hypothetical protein